MTVPKFLYRYLSLRGVKDLSRAIESIERSALWLSCPLGFNDAHEGAVRLKMPTDPVSKADNELLCEILGKPPAWPKQLRREALQDRALEMQHHLDTFQTRDYLGKVVACCLSSVPDHPLMWAHDAAAYNGVCIEIAPAESDFLLENPEEVTYRSSPREYVIGGDEGELGRCVAATKSDDWSYEKEWRVLLPPPEGYAACGRGSFSGLILGRRYRK